jgi:hypothetical protein
MITFTCKCGKTYKVDDKHAGKKGTCSKCKRTIIVPDANEKSFIDSFVDELCNEPLEKGAKEINSEHTAITRNNQQEDKKIVETPDQNTGDSNFEYCQNCGSKISKNATICMKCGVPMKKNNLSSAKSGSGNTGRILSWVFGILLIIAGIGVMQDSVLGGLLIVICASLMLPIIPKIPGKVRVSMGIACVAILVVIAPEMESQAEYSSSSNSFERFANELDNASKELETAAREFEENVKSLDNELSRTNKVSEVYREGQQFATGYTSYKIWRSWWSSKLSDNVFLNEAPNAMYLFVELSVRNEDNKARTIPPFMLIDENGSQYETSNMSWSVEGSIGLLDSLNPGVHKQGVIIFDVPQNHIYKLKVSGGYWSAQDALIQLTPKK